MTRNSLLFKEAQQHFPGGVNSPVRSFAKAGGHPLIASSAKGAYIYDADGNQYLDFCCAWGAAILGHADPLVQAEVTAALSKGTLYGITNEKEIVLAQLVKQCFPSIEKLRFVNSGTEAVMSALRLARAYTQKKYIVKFDGCYHGHSDALLVKAGSGLVHLNEAGSEGVIPDQVKGTISIPFNHIPSVEEAFEKHGKDIAAIIVEPVPGNMGVIEPALDFLNTLRTLTIQHQSLLIFDEVITGFRLARGGAQEYYGIEADITVLGKIIGGGFPAAAFGASAPIMNRLAPSGNVYQAGTFSGNPISMTAGIATLQQLLNKNTYWQLNSYTQAFTENMRKQLQSFPVQIQHTASMFSFFFSDHKASDYQSAQLSDGKIFAALHLMLRSKGIFLAPANLEANFISTQHLKIDPELSAKSIADSIKEVYQNEYSYA